jgi:dienelactone hydrolase
MAVRTVSVGLIFLYLAPFCLSQEPDVRQAPLPIEFPAWREVPSDDHVREFKVEFPSAAKTAYPVNDVVHVTAILPPKAAEPMPTVVLLHYWGATDKRVERNIADELASRGTGAVIVTLPYHLERTPQGSRSGALAIEPDPVRLNATMRQCVLDVRRTLDWIESRPEFDRSRIGMAGTSLGALVAALVTGIDSRIHSASYILGGADLTHILWRSSRVVTEREALRQKGYTEERMRQELAPIEPLNFLKDLRPKRTFVVGAKYDTVIPSAATQSLIEALDEPAVLWLDTGHYGGFFVQKRVHDEVAKFFAASFAGSPYTPPSRISAPTIRLGVSLNPDTGLQVAAGIDIWRGDAAGNYFASFQVAPRGVQVFAGKRLDRGLAIGVFLRVSSITPGVFWSIVL